VEVHRNDTITISDIEAMNPERIVISPGPCSPDEAGISLEVVRHFAGRVPILGVCLGHQCIGQVFGGKVIRAGQVMHGKTSMIHHNGQGVFAGLENPFEATRYHSLVVDKDHWPEDELEITAWTQNEDGSMEEVMGLRHRSPAHRRGAVPPRVHHDPARARTARQLPENAEPEVTTSWTSRPPLQRWPSART